MYRIDEGKRAAAAPRLLSGRGVAYWTDGKGDERIFMVTIGYQLVALEAKTGIPVRGFGQNGVLDLKQNNDQVLDPITGEIGLNTGPIVAKDVVIVGAAHRAGGCAAQQDERERVHPRLRREDRKASVDLPHHSAAGRVRQRDVGERLVVVLGQYRHVGAVLGRRRARNRLHADRTVHRRLLRWPPPGQQPLHGVAAWRWTCTPESANGTFSSSITEFGTSIFRARRYWPTSRSTASPVKAVAVPSKQGFLYVFDRQTGQPVWPIVERPVEKGTVPGEWYSPTQPFPTKPPPFELQGVQEKDLIDFTPELLAEAKKVAANIKLGPLFTPPIPRGQGGKIGTAYIANGANWPGGSYDPETGILYVYSNTLTRLLILANDPKRSDMDFINTGGGGDTGVWWRRPRVQPDAVRDHGSGAAVCQTAMGAHHRNRSQQR